MQTARFSAAPIRSRPAAIAQSRSRVAFRTRAAVSTESPVTYTQIDNKKNGKPRVVVLGSGWASMSFIKALPASVSDKYEITLVSPRNYFLYTPLLPAVATGTMEERSIVEPVRKFMGNKGEYYEALCQDINPEKKELVCCFPKDTGFSEACFKVPYDVLVMGVGCVNNTFGIKGVDEYCNYFKSIEDANRLRSRLSECFERASLPAVPEEERKKLLSFVVVGGGPTGVEVAAEMYDMISNDLIKLYPKLKDDFKIRIVELMDHVLSTYDREISNFTADVFKRAGISLVLNSRVASVQDGIVNVVNKENEEESIPFGACVWATGIAMNPLLRSLQEKFPGQTHFRSLLTNEYLEMKGSNGSVWVIGDASTIDQPKALDFVEQLFDQADVNKDGALSLQELQSIMEAASSKFTHLAEHARFLRSQKGMNKLMGKAMGRKKNADGQMSGEVVSLLETYDDNTYLTKEEFGALLAKIDKGLRALPATAQVAKQQGDYLAALFMSNEITGTENQELKSEPFKYNHKGSAAYVGMDQAVFDVPKIGPLTGTGAGVLWKSFETYSQFSFRNQCLVASDWLRTKLFGRDISRV